MSKEEVLFNLEPKDNKPVPVIAPAGSDSMTNDAVYEILSEKVNRFIDILQQYGHPAHKEKITAVRARLGEKIAAGVIVENFVPLVKNLVTGEDSKVIKEISERWTDIWAEHSPQIYDYSDKKAREGRELKKKEYSIYNAKDWTTLCMLFLKHIPLLGIDDVDEVTFMEPKKENGQGHLEDGISLLDLVEVKQRFTGAQQMESWAIHLDVPNQFDIMRYIALFCELFNTEQVNVEWVGE